MILAVLSLQVLLLVAVLALWLRQSPARHAVQQDPRHTALPDQITQLHVRHEALDLNLRTGLSDLRSAHGSEALSTREANARAFSDLRTELTTSLDHFRGDNTTAAAALRAEVLGNLAALGTTLKAELAHFRQDNAQAAQALHTDVHTQHEAIQHKLGASSTEARQHNDAAREALHTRLTELAAANTAQSDKLRATVGDALQKLNADNTAKLEDMRRTVDEKLNATLQTRLNESFGMVTTHLGEVQKGLGEMKELANGVGDLKKVLSNVKSRGVVGEFQLGQQLEQMFSPEQYIKNARIKPNTAESVEYALKFPSGEGPGTHTLLPIDAKFPKEDWERLEHAYEHGTAEEIAAAGKAFERTIRAEADRICKKYIDPPTTLPHGIMFLPTENLYAEVVRRPGLQSEVQSNCRVTIAGPSTFMAILTSFQMGFHTLAIQKKGDEVWRVLSSTKNEFEKFGGLMDKVRKQVDSVQNTLGDISGKTKTINRALKNVSSIDTGPPTSPLNAFEEIAGIAPLLAAVAGDD